MQLADAGGVPEGVTAPVQHGERTSAFVLYLLRCQLLPEKRLAALMADLFGVKLAVTEHRAHGCCVACSLRTRGAFPEGVTAPVQHGERTSAFVLYLLHCQLLPEKRLAALMADLFGVKLATATTARISRDCAQRFQGFADAVRDHVAAAPVKPMDETGLRIGGETQWLHIASTVWLTLLARLGEAGQPAGEGHRHYRA